MRVFIESNNLVNGGTQRDEDVSATRVISVIRSLMGFSVYARVHGTAALRNALSCPFLMMMINNVDSSGMR